MIYEIIHPQANEGEHLPVAIMCQTLDLDRSEYYRLKLGDEQFDAEIQLRDHIQRIALEWPGYGYRRITAQLHRQGVVGKWQTGSAIDARR